MKKSFLALAAIFGLFGSSLQAIDGEVAFPIDGRAWTLLDPLLPAGQDRVWLVPEGHTARDREFIIVEEFSKDIKLKDLTLSLDLDDEGSEVYMREVNRDFLAVAAKNGRTGKYSVNHVFKSGGHVAEITYVVPFERLAVSEREHWMKRWGQSFLGAPKLYGAWLTITDKTAYQNGMELAVVGGSQLYRDFEDKFSIKLPASWGWSEQRRGRDSDEGKPHFVTHLIFTRLDNLALGNVAIAEYSTAVSEQEINQGWERSLDRIRAKEGYEILDSGDITNMQGKKGKFIVVKDPNSWVAAKAFYQSGKLSYKVECRSTEEENYPQLEETFQFVLTHFSPQK